MPPGTRRRDVGERLGMLAGQALAGVSGGGGVGPVVNRIIASASRGSVQVTGSSEAKFIDEEEAVTSYGPDPILTGVPGASRWIIHGYVIAKSSAPAAGGLSILIGNTEPNITEAAWLGTVDGQQKVYVPPWPFYGVDAPNVEAAWAGDSIDTLGLHIRADRQT